jgi:hypothetical protein
MDVACATLWKPEKYIQKFSEFFEFKADLTTAKITNYEGPNCIIFFILRLVSVADITQQLSYILPLWSVTGTDRFDLEILAAKENVFGQVPSSASNWFI